MQIGQILDKTTVVIVGPGVEGLKVNEELQILAVGHEIPNLGVPLVVPKAQVRLENVAGAYGIARTGTYEVEVSPTAAFSALTSLVFEFFVFLLWRQTDNFFKLRVSVAARDELTLKPFEKLNKMAMVI
jgi:hypothetical protein